MSEIGNLLPWIYGENCPAKPPLGVMPWWLWSEHCPAPTLGELLDRYIAVSQAVDRYLAAGLLPPPDWLVELGSCR